MGLGLSAVGLLMTVGLASKLETTSSQDGGGGRVGGGLSDSGLSGVCAVKFPVSTPVGVFAGTPWCVLLRNPQLPWTSSCTLPCAFS